MQKYSQVASNKASIQAAQNWAKSGLSPWVVVITSGNLWWALSNTFLNFEKLILDPPCLGRGPMDDPLVGIHQSLSFIIYVFCCLFFL